VNDGVPCRLETESADRKSVGNDVGDLPRRARPTCGAVGETFDVPAGVVFRVVMPAALGQHRLGIGATARGPRSDVIQFRAARRTFAAREPAAAVASDHELAQRLGGPVGGAAEVQQPAGVVGDRAA
jgi:hypothetical protein